MSKPFVHLSLSRSLAVVDLETTGLDPRSDRIVEVAALRFAPGGGRLRFHRRVNPGVPIPGSATAVHGIADADVAHCPPFAAVAAPLARFLRDSDLCGYNLKRFDLPLLLEEFRRAGVRFTLARRAVVDVYEIYHRREPRNLPAAVRLYLDRAHDGAHGALADAYATAAVLDAQLLRYADLPRSVARLHAYFAGADVSGRLRREDGELVLTFGKYAGRTLASVARADAGYLQRLLAEDCLPDFSALVERALAHAERSRNERMGPK